MQLKHNILNRQLQVMVNGIHIQQSGMLILMMPGKKKKSMRLTLAITGTKVAAA